jgi:hypothetical protein
VSEGGEGDDPRGGGGEEGGSEFSEEEEVTDVIDCELHISTCRTEAIAQSHQPCIEDEEVEVRGRGRWPPLPGLMGATTGHRRWSERSPASPLLSTPHSTPPSWR